MARNRRNKRSFKELTNLISFKTFIILFIIFSIIIGGCLTVLWYRNNKDKEMLAKQREELDKEIKAIFVETNQNIEDSNNSKRDSLIRISAVGDILCGEEMLEDALNKEYNTYSFSHMFKNITRFINKSDIVLGTMESNFTDEKYSGYGNRNSPKEFANAVKESGINLVSICTNHSLDYGIEGLKDTKQYLESIGFSTVGDRLENERAVTIKTVKNAKIAFISYTTEIENKTKDELKSICVFDKETAKKDIEYAKENADFIIAIMHWGDSYATKPNEKQKEIANFLIENGVGAILGNHPAVIQSMEIVKNKEDENVLVAYSLGNYIASIDNDNSKIELVLNIELRKRGEDGKVVLSKVDYTPIYALDNGEKAENRFELIDMKGVAKAYANGNTDVVDKKTYEKLIDGLKLLEKVVWGEQ